MIFFYLIIEDLCFDICSGYMAPEYIKHGEFSIKSDVFSFGVIILEIVCGRRNTKIRDGENIKDLLDNVSFITINGYKNFLV